MLVRGEHTDDGSESFSSRREVLAVDLAHQAAPYVVGDLARVFVKRFFHSGIMDDMIFYALTSSDSNFAIDVFATRAAAEAAMRSVIEDEPAFEPLLSIVLVEPPWTTPSWADLAANLQ